MRAAQAYAIPGLKTGAVIGVGGGRDILSQRLFGVRDVTGIEINPIIIDILKPRIARSHAGTKSNARSAG